MRPVPIFVLGLQRSGTTWIGNLLAAHPQVAGVTDVRHRGIHESLFFSHFAKAWDWSDPVGRSDATEAFLQSDYGRLLGLNDAEIERCREITAPAESLRHVMNCLAARTGKKAWVEKSPHHIMHAHEIAAAMPDARFVTIHRDAVSLVASRRRAYGRQPKRGIAGIGVLLRGAVSNVFHHRLLDRFRRENRDRVIAIDYARFKDGGEEAIAALLKSLDLAPQPGLASEFSPNSSFGDVFGGAPDLNILERLIVRTTEVLAGAVPVSVLSAMRRLSAPTRIEFPAWVWSAGPPDKVRIASRSKAEVVMRPASIDQTATLKIDGE